MINFDPTISPKEAAEALGISVSKAYALCATNPAHGGIPSYKIGGRVKIKEKDLRAWIEQQKRW